MGAGGAGVVGDDLTGTTIGSYEVLARLATGGMAELLLAKRTGIEGFQKVVVLKRILPHFASTPDFVEMFLHEARLAATLEHPNIVPVFDIGKAGDDYYFAMAYLHGRDVLAILRELSRRGQRMPIVHAIAVAAGIAAGLHHAHERLGFDGEPLGIVHRDVSPANAIVTFDGAVKLVDFGIAKASAQTNVTRVGVRKGKAAYMSPEQCRGDPLDRRTDIWSLGIVLYEMITMTRAFRADSELAIMHRIVSQDVPPPSKLQPDLPEDLEAIVMRCLQRDPGGRWQTAHELQRELERFCRAHNLAPGGPALGEFLTGLFGNVPFPWAQASTSAASLRPASSGPRPADVIVRAAGLSAMPPVFAKTVAPDAVTTPTGPPRGVADPRPGFTAPYPATAAGPAGPAGPVDPAMFSSSTGTDERSRREPITDIVAPRRTAAGITVTVLAIAAVALIGWSFAGRDDTPAPAAAVSASAGGAPVRTADPGGVPASTTPPEAERLPSPADLEAWLAAVHQSEPERALDWATRHALLDRLEASDAHERIDRRVQLALDLRQAADAPRPCTAFASTLEAIAAANDDAWFAVALASANVPDASTAPHAGTAPDRSCEGLATRLDELRTRTAPAGTSTALPAPSSAGLGKPKRPRPSESRPASGTAPAAPATQPRPPKAPDPPRAPDVRKLDEDELRPFRK